MFDSISTDALPPDAVYLAGYVDGEWADYEAIRVRFPQANVLSIAVIAADDADCLDIETGDATPADAPAWFRRQLARGVARPCLYADASTMETIVPVLQASGIGRSAVRLWSAHYTYEPHICGPAPSCGAVSIAVDGTQWTDQAGAGGDADESLLLPDFFGPDPVPQPAPPVPAWEAAMIAALPTLAEGADDATLPHGYVRRIQAIAAGVFGVSPGLAIDGAFGPLTTAAVRQVQRQAGVAADGVVGPVTWSVLVTGSAP